MGEQEVDRSVGEPRAQGERQAGRGHHLGNDGRHQTWKVAAAVVGREGQGSPAGGSVATVRLGEAGRRGDRAVVVTPAVVAVADAVERGDDLGDEPGRLGEKAFDEVGVDVGVAGHFGQPGEVDDLVEHEPDVVQGGNVVAHGATVSPSPGGVIVPGDQAFGCALWSRHNCISGGLTSPAGAPPRSASGRPARPTRRPAARRGGAGRAPLRLCGHGIGRCCGEGTAGRPSSCSCRRSGGRRGPSPAAPRCVSSPSARSPRVSWIQSRAESRSAQSMAIGAMSMKGVTGARRSPAATATAWALSAWRWLRRKPSIPRAGSPRATDTAGSALAAIAISGCSRQAGLRRQPGPRAALVGRRDERRGRQRQRVAERSQESADERKRVGPVGLADPQDHGHMVLVESVVEGPLGCCHVDAVAAQHLPDPHRPHRAVIAKHGVPGVGVDGQHLLDDIVDVVRDGLGHPHRGQAFQVITGGLSHELVDAVMEEPRLADPVGADQCRGRVRPAGRGGRRSRPPRPAPRPPPAGRCRS